MTSPGMRTRLVGSTLLAAALVAELAVAPGAAIAARPGGSRALALGLSQRSATPAQATSILVTYRDSASVLDQGAARTRAGVTRERGRPDLQLDVVRPARGRSIADAVAALDADSAVAFAEPNRRMVLAADPAAEEYFPVQWGLENHGGDCVGGATAVLGLDCVNDVDIDAVAGWSSATGAGITIAILDDGLDFSQSELAGQAWVNTGETGIDGSANDKATNGVDDDGNGFVDDVNGVNLCTADAPTTILHRAGVDWHGTAVASIVGAAANGTRIVGVAPGARLMAVRWLVKDTCDTTFDAINAIDYAVANGADVINASWGGPDDSLALEAAIGRANAAGVLIAAAAGNEGVTSPFYPAASSASNVVSVGALEPDGHLAAFSNRGAWVDLAAPGDAIAALCLDTSICSDVWTFLPGTSFAAPHVAGVAAMVLELRPDLRNNAAALRSKLINSGVQSSLLGGGLTGSGRRLNAGYAVDVTPPSAPGVQVRARANSTIGSTTASMTITWPASTDASGIDSYRVRYRKAGASTWTTIASATTSRTVRATLTMAQRYDIQVIARDRGGNTTASTITTTPTRYSESSSRASYSGTWTLVSN
ncbi:MAG TPA: S8 family serine peptidase, partial [Candidatus Limnocylindrales bacterium]